VGQPVTARRGLLIAFLALGAGSLAAQAPTADLAAVKLTDLSWIAGHWVDETEGKLSEEVWTTPAGDSMLGMWRYVSGGKLRISELLSIQQGDAGLVFRLRHFDPPLVGREDKERAVELRLVRFLGQEASFEGAEYDGKGRVRLTYRALGRDGLRVTLEKGGKAEEFAFKRR